MFPEGFLGCYIDIFSQEIEKKVAEVGILENGCVFNLKNKNPKNLLYLIKTRSLGIFQDAKPIFLVRKLKKCFLIRKFGKQVFFYPEESKCYKFIIFNRNAALGGSSDRKIENFIQEVYKIFLYPENTKIESLSIL